MFNLLFCIVNYIFVSASVSPHLKMGVLGARDFIRILNTRDIMNNSFNLTSLSSLYVQELDSCTYGTRQVAKNASQHPLKNRIAENVFCSKTKCNFF